MSGLRWSERAMKVRAEYAIQAPRGLPQTAYVRLLSQDVLTLLDRVERMRACIEPANPSPVPPVRPRPPIDEKAEEILSELIRITTGRRPDAGEFLDVTLALLRNQPTIQEDITALWRHV